MAVFLYVYIKQVVKIALSSYGYAARRNGWARLQRVRNKHPPGGTAGACSGQNIVKLHWLDGAFSEMQGDIRRSFDTMAIQVFDQAGISSGVPVKSNKINKAGAGYGI